MPSFKRLELAITFAALSRSVIGVAHVTSTTKSAATNSNEQTLFQFC